MRDAFDSRDRKRENTVVISINYNFLTNIRRYNSMFAFTSMGGKVDKSVNKGKGPYVFRLSGQNYHSIGTLAPKSGSKPKFIRLYIYDTEHEDSNRQSIFSDSTNMSTSTSKDLDLQIIQHLKEMLDSDNVLVQFCRRARDCFEADPNVDIRLRLISKRTEDGRTHNLPTASEVAALIVGDIGNSFDKRDIIINTVDEVVYTVELQKRGLPHAHICLFIDGADKLPNVEHVDPFISAEIPDKKKEPDVYCLVKDFMLHGPCGPDDPNCPCMIDRKCSKKFPKKFREHTSIDSKGYPLYKRRDCGSFVEKSGAKLDNRHVIPYNKTLLKKYQAHINVEWCNQASSIKYLFKYINKGPDRATVSVVQTIHENGNKQPIDEINDYYDCRYLSACEASWRIFGYDVHYRKPSVTRLPFHLPNQQQVVYGPDDDLDDVLEKRSVASSVFLGWMKCNERYEEARQLTYVESPTRFVWKDDTRSWKPRKKGFSVRRIHSVSPSLGEAYFLRILLNKVKGPTSFQKIRTVNGREYPTFREACYSMGLLDDDMEYIEAIQEASHSGTGIYLRTMFSSMLTCNSLSRPEYVWEKTWDILADGILHKQQLLLKSPDLELNED